LKLTNALITDVLAIFRLRKAKEEHKLEDELKSTYDLGDNYIKCIKDYEVRFGKEE
jgi:hypothetical protein